MEAHAAHHHHEMPTGGKELNSLALTATLHCLTGCAIGEVLGVAIGTALGWSDLATIALAVSLAFLLGYSFTSYPLLRAGMALGAVVPVALAADTFSIAVMEIVDNAVMLVIPGAMDAGLDSFLFWGALSFALAVAFALAVPVNRWLLKRGKGHTAVHETGIHGGPDTRYVAIGITLAALFGTTVLVAEAVDGDDGERGGGHAAEPAKGEPAAVRGLAAAEGGYTLTLGRDALAPGREQAFTFQVLGEDRKPVRDFEVEHEKRMHLIVARRDLTGFQHLHPRLTAGGTWSTPVRIDEPGRYRVFADFKRGGENRTLAHDLTVAGAAQSRPLPAPSALASAGGGYDVRLRGASRAGEESELSFEVTRNGRPVEVERYLGAGGHLVALRERDLAYLHVHPTSGGERGAASDPGHGDGTESAPVAFATEFPSAGRYRLFLQFKHAGKVRTAAFTREVGG